LNRKKKRIDKEFGSFVSISVFLLAWIFQGHKGYAESLGLDNIKDVMDFHGGMSEGFDVL